MKDGKLDLNGFRDIANSATTSLSGFVAGLKSVAVNMAIFFAISAAIQLVIKGLDKLIVTQDELNEKFEDSVDKYNDLKSEIQSLNTELESTKDTIEKLEELPSLTLIEQEQLRDLKETRKELERQLELKNALAKSRYSEAGQDARNYFASTSQYNTGYSIDRDAISYKAGFVLQSSGSKFGNPIEEANAQLQIYEQLMEDIESTEIRILELKKDENYENSSAYKSAQKELSALNAKASEVNKSLSDSYNNFSAKKNYLDIDTDSELLNSISKFEDELYRVLSIGTSPTDKFNKLWDSSEFRSYKLELENISKLGKLDESVLSSNEKYKELLDATGLSASEVASHINSIVFAAENAGKLALSSSSFENAFNNLPIEKIEEYVAIANSDGFNKNNIESFNELNNIVKETGVSIDEVNSTIKTIAESGGFVLSVDLITGIQDSYDVLEEVKKSFNDTKTIGLESLNKISAKYPELNTAIAQYNQGLISSEDLIHKLELAYQNDVEEYRSAMVEKLSSDEGFWTKVIEHNKEYFSDLSSAYGVDLQNYKTLAEAKAGIDAELIKKLSIGWSQYYDAIIDPLTGLATGGANFEGDENSDLLNGGHSENLKLVKQAADAYNESKKKLNEIAENAKNLISLPDFGSVDDDDTDSKSSGSSSSNKKEEIDWIARKNELLQKQHDIQEQIANDETVSYNERKAALLDLIEKDKTLAATAEESAEKYKQAWLEASADLTASDRAKIANESDNMNIEKYDAKDLLEKGIVSSIEDGEKYIDNLKKSIEYYDLWKEYDQTAIDKKKEGEKHQRTSIQLLQEEINKQLDLNSALADQVNTRMELLEAQGKYVNEGHYEELIRLSKEEVKYQQDSIDALYEQLELEDEYSAEWYGVKAQIEAAENAIEQCRVEQEELNDQIKRLPIERIQIFRDLYAEVVEDMDNYMAIQSSMGLNPTKEELQQYIDLYNESIDASLEQQQKLKDLLSNYSYGSEKYKNTSKEIQNLDNEINKLIVSQTELNHEMLQIPVNEMSYQIDKLGTYKDALQNSIAEDNANGLQTTIDQYKDLHSITLQQLGLYTQQKTELTKLLDVYEKDSQYYKDTEKEIANIDSEMSSLVQDTYKWNQELLNIPIENLEKTNENLSSYSSILGDVITNYDEALEGVNALVDAEIEGIQDQLDLLNESNEARKIQIALEQAQYNLERARNQKTTKVIRDGEITYEANVDDMRSAQQELADAQYDKMVYGLEQQIERLEDIKEKWADIVKEIEKAKAIQNAEDMFGMLGWKEAILSGDDESLYTMFKSLYESTTAQKESVDEQIESNERISQMMNEFVTRYQEGSLTYEQAINGINEMIASMEGGFSAFEQLNGMMNLDNIASLGDIASSAEASITGAAELLNQYLSIVESNKSDVKDFETDWKSASEGIQNVINSFNIAVDSMDGYISAFQANAEEIGKNTKSWEEMKQLIEEQVNALKEAAEELEKLSKQSSSKPSSSSSSSSRSDDGNGTYYRINGQRYHESEGSAAELITKHGTQEEQDSYWKYRENLITNNKNASDEGWKEAALKALEEEKSALKAHTGIFKGAIGQGSTQLDKILQDMAIINDDEHVRILQKGERVYTPDQILNTIDNAQRMSLPKAENLLSYLTSNPFAQTTSIDTAKVTDLIETGNKAIIPPNKQSIQNSVNVEFSGGITVNEVQNGEEFAHNLFTQISPVMEQKFSKLF